MAKRLTKGEKRAALRKGAGGSKPGLWKHMWQKRARNLRKKK